MWLRLTFTEYITNFYVIPALVLSVELPADKYEDDEFNYYGIELRWISIGIGAYIGIDWNEAE